MSTVEHIEDEVRNLSPDERASFRSWFLEFDARHWDEQTEKDAQSAVAAMRALPRIKGVDPADLQRAGGKTYEPSE